MTQAEKRHYTAGAIPFLSASSRSGRTLWLRTKQAALRRCRLFGNVAFEPFAPFASRNKAVDFYR